MATPPDQRRLADRSEHHVASNSFKICNLAGIDVRIHWTWLFVFLLITWSMADPHGILHQFHPGWGAGRRWIAGAVIALIFFASILLHEFSHSLVAKARGIPVKDITLFVFGGVSSLEREAASAREEFQIAIVGPLTSLAIGAVFAVIWAVLRGPAPSEAAVAGYLAFINGVLAGFNMLPGFPLDGGRVFRSIMWSRNHDLLRATRTAARVGEFVAYAVIAIGLIQFLIGNVIGGIWMVLIGLFLRNASASSYAQMVVERSLAGIAARDVATSQYVGVSPEMTVQQLVDEYVLTGRGRAFPVVAGEELLGLATLTDVQRCPRSQWPVTTVYRIMTPTERLHTIPPGNDIMSVLRTMDEAEVNQVPVVEGRRIVGVVTRTDVLRFIQVRQAVAAD